jgi:DNA-binding response OmpR family regulator
MPHILLIERDQFTASNIINSLSRLGWDITHFPQPSRGFKEAYKNIYQLVILGDVGESPSNITLCKRLRSDEIATALLVLVKNYNVENIVNLLEAGADACMAKPFSSRELAARCQALIKRIANQSQPAIKIADLELDKHRRVLHRRGKPIYLRRREFEILTLLAENHDRVLSRSHINLRTNTASYDCDDNCVDVHISNIRKALQEYGCSGVIETVHGVGYKLNKVAV